MHTHKQSNPIWISYVGKFTIMDIFEPASEGGMDTGEGMEKQEEKEESDKRNYNLSSKGLEKALWTRQSWNRATTGKRWLFQMCLLIFFLCILFSLSQHLEFEVSTTECWYVLSVLTCTIYVYWDKISLFTLL